MVVLQLGPYPPPHGGVQSNLVAIRQQLRRRFGPHAAPVINLTRHRRQNDDDVHYPSSALGVAKLLMAMPADIIHLHIGGNLTTRLLALCLFCSLIPNRRVIMTFHSGGYPSWQNRAPRRFSLRRLILRRLDAIVTVNAEIDGFFRNLGVDPSRLKTICPYAPVSLRDAVVLPEGLARFINTHTPTLTTVGLLEPEYDLPLQIRMLGALRERFHDAGLVIVGSGSLEAELRRVIAEQPYAEHILLCGDVPHPVTLHAISQSDVFLRTTRYDGDSVSVREALQLGVPVVATDNGMRPAGVLLIPRSDASALADAISTVVGRSCITASALARRDLGRRDTGYKQPEKTSRDCHLEEMVDLYSRLIGGTAAKRTNQTIDVCS
jgi:glycosyltransferase involved in cell wall biosynthesis